MRADQPQPRCDHRERERGHRASLRLSWSEDIGGVLDTRQQGPRHGTVSATICMAALAAPLRLREHLAGLPGRCHPPVPSRRLGRSRRSCSRLLRCFDSRNHSRFQPSTRHWSWTATSPTTEGSRARAPLPGSNTETSIRRSWNWWERSSLNSP